MIRTKFLYNFHGKCAFPRYVGQFTKIRKSSIVRNHFNSSVLAAFALLSISTAAHAQSVLSNLTGNDGGSTGITTNAAPIRYKAVGGTVGTKDLSFVSFVARLNNNDSLAHTVNFSIYSSLSANPNKSLVTFTKSLAANSATADVTFNHASTFVLKANTSYWFVISSPDIIANKPGISVDWTSNNPIVTPTNTTNMTFIGARINTGGTWAASSLINSFQVNAAVVPEPSAVAFAGIMGAGLVGLVLRRRRA